MSNSADQRVSVDAKERYTVLRKQLDDLIASLNKVLGR